MVSRPLEGLRVLDLTRFVAGSYTTALLAAFGAEVLSSRSRPGGDPYRVQGTERLGDESVLFLSLNSGKRSVALDFRSPDRPRTRSSACSASSQFLVENGRPGSLARARPGLGAACTRGVPRSSTARSPGTATSGPDAARGGFDLILQAESGIMSVTGSEESGPVKVGAPVLDVGAGPQLRGRSPRRARRAGAHGDRDAMCRLRCWSSRCPSLGTLADRDVRLGSGAGAAGHALTDVRPVRRASARGRMDRPRGRRVRGPVGAMLHGSRRAKGCSGPEVRGQRGAGPSPRRADGGVRGGPADAAQRGLAGAAHRRRRCPPPRSSDVAQVFSSAQTEALGAVQHLRAPECRRVRRSSGRPLRLDHEVLTYPAPAPTLGADTRAVLVEVGRHRRRDRRARRGGSRDRMSEDSGCARGRRRAPHDRALVECRRPPAARAIVPSSSAPGGRRTATDDVRLDTVGNVWARARAGDGTGHAVVRAPGYRLRGGCAARGADTRRCAARSERRRRLGRRGGAVRGRVLARTGLDARVVALDRRRGGPREPPRGDLRARVARGEVGAFVAVEGNYLGRVSMTGVGSSSPPGRRPRAGRARVGGRRVAERDPSSGRAGRPDRVDPAHGGDLGERRPHRRRRGHQHAGARGVVRGRSACRRSRRAGCAHRFARGARSRRSRNRCGSSRRCSAIVPPGASIRAHPLVGAAVEALASVQIEATSPGDEHRRERCARARDPGGRPRHHDRLGRTHPAGVDRRGTDRARPPSARGTVHEYEVRCA